MRVEIELAALAPMAPLASAVLVVLALCLIFRHLFNDTVGATPPWRPVVVSPARQENKDAQLPNTHAPLRSFLLHVLFQPFFYHFRRFEARPARYLECYLQFLNESASDPFLDY